MYEQNNKGDGGVIGITEDRAQLLRWMISGPEIARLVNEFKCNVENSKVNELKVKEKRYHELYEIRSVQNTFKKQVDDLCNTMEQFGNPFKENSVDLIVLDKHDIVSEDVIETFGKDQYERFCQERLVEISNSSFDSVKANKLPLFSLSSPKKKSTKSFQLSNLKQNCSLFSQLYVSCQVREGDEVFFVMKINVTHPHFLCREI